MARVRSQRAPASSSGVPPELAAAIASSAERYAVPPDVLTGIWRVESGSSFPNPYVNSIGYGGLFGTTDWNGSTQSQADLAASILARLIREKGGDLAQALLSYSGGGYSSVPGQVTSGTVMTPNRRANVPAASSPSPSRTRPDSAGDGGVWGGIEGFLGGAAGGVESASESAWKGVMGPFNSLVDVFKGLVWLLQPQSWLRMVEFVTGTTMMLFGLIGLAVVFLQRSETVGAAAGVAAVLPGPVGAAGRAVTTVRRPRQAIRTRQQATQRRQRSEMDSYYRERADELDPRRRARAEQRELRQDAARERRDNARAVAQASRERRSQGDEVPF